MWKLTVGIEVSELVQVSAELLWEISDRILQIAGTRDSPATGR